MVLEHCKLRKVALVYRTCTIMVAIAKSSAASTRAHDRADEKVEIARSACNLAVLGRAHGSTSVLVLVRGVGREAGPIALGYRHGEGSDRSHRYVDVIYRPLPVAARLVVSTGNS